MFRLFARKRRSQKKKNQERFYKDPFQFARQLFQQPRSGSLSVQKEQLETHLRKTYSDPQGNLKVWCLQFMLIPKLLWPLLVYEICSNTVKAIEAKINKFTRRWLAVPPGLTDVAMYCRKAKLRLPLKSILEEYKCGKARLLSMSEDSEDPVVKTVQPTIKTGRKWKVVEALGEAKECLKIKEVIGQTQTDRKGLGSSTAKWWSKAEGKEKRDMVINEIRLNEDSRRVQKAVQ